MTIELPPDLAEKVQERINSGGFETPLDVVRDALDQQRDEDVAWLTTDELRREAAVGIEQLERGEYQTYPNGAAVAEAVHARGRARIAGRAKPGP